MAQGLLKGLAAGIAVSAGLIVVSSQTLDQTTVIVGSSASDARMQAFSPDETTTEDVTTDPVQEIAAGQQDQAEDAPTAETADVAVSERSTTGQETALEAPAQSDAAAPDAPIDTAREIEKASESEAVTGDASEIAETVTPDTLSAAVSGPDRPMAQEAPMPTEEPTDRIASETLEVASADASADRAMVAPDEPTQDPEPASRTVPVATTPLDDTKSPSISADVDRPDSPQDGAAPTRPAGLDEGPTVAEGAAPIAPVADAAPELGEGAPSVKTGASPSLDQPETDGDGQARATPNSDAPILPVPESLPPPTPAPDTAPVAADAPRRAGAGPMGIGDADGLTSVVAPSALIDGDSVTARAALETAIQSGDRPADAADDLSDQLGRDEDRAPDPTGRDRVRVNRLAQITPPEPEAESEPEGDETVEADSEDDPASAEDAPSAPSEDVLLSEDAAASDEDATEGQEATASRRSSNLIERRLQAAAARTADGEEQTETDGESPTSRRSAALAPRDSSRPPQEPATTNDPEVASEPAAPSTGVAMEDFDQPFDNPEGLPLVSVVLLDYGGPMIDLPLPLSVALDARQPRVAARAAAYRARGYEVLVIPSLPKGGTAQDIEQALQGSLGAVDGAVAVLPDPSSDVQSDRAAIETIVGRLGESGLGLVSFPQGLNGAQQVAAREDVPAGLVFRQVDGDGQDLRAVKRFLDQAAFRARQEDAVILVGRNRPETRGALMEWRLGNRAESVQLAPVTAAIRALSP